MDIDEFLDRELGSKQGSSNLVNTTSIPQPGVSPSQLSLAGSSNMNQILSQHDQLWKQLLDMQYTWDQQTTGQVHQSLRSLQKQLITLHGDLQKRKQATKTMLIQLQELIRLGNINAATKLYDQTQEILSGIDDLFFEDKQQLTYELSAIYKAMQDKWGTQQQFQLKQMKLRLDTLIRDAHTLLRTPKLDEAKRRCDEAMQMYLNLPLISLPMKLYFGDKLLDLYKNISIQSQIRILQSQLSPSVKSALNTSPIPTQDQSRQAYTHQQYLARKIVQQKMARAQAHMEKGYPSEAHKELSTVLKLDPKNKSAQQMLQDIIKG